MGLIVFSRREIAWRTAFGVSSQFLPARIQGLRERSGLIWMVDLVAHGAPARIGPLADWQVSLASTVTVAAPPCDPVAHFCGGGRTIGPCARRDCVESLT